MSKGRRVVARKHAQRWKDRQLDGYEDRSHHLLVVKEVPDTLQELRRELQHGAHRDICLAAIKETTFEGSLATIGEKLDIVLDGTYDVGPLCQVLLQALRARRMGTKIPGNLGLITGAEIVEREGEVSLELAPSDGAPDSPVPSSKPPLVS